MLKCKDIVNQASAIVDNELTLMERLNVRFHLFMCVHCRRFIKQFKLLIGSSRRREEQVLSDEAAAVIAAKVQADYSPS